MPLDTRAALVDLKAKLAAAKAAQGEAQQALAGELISSLQRLGSEAERAELASALRVLLDARSFDGLADAEGREVREAALAALVASGFPRGVPQPPPQRPLTASDRREHWFQQRALYASLLLLCLGVTRLVMHLMGAKPFDIALTEEQLKVEAALVFIGGWGLFGDRLAKRPEESWFGKKMRRELSILCGAVVLTYVVFLGMGLRVDWPTALGCLGTVLALTPWSDA